MTKLHVQWAMCAQVSFLFRQYLMQKGIQSHTNLCIQTSVCIPLLWDSVRRVKRLGRANAKEWDVKVRFPIH